MKVLSNGRQYELVLEILSRGSRHEDGMNFYRSDSSNPLLCVNSQIQ